VRALPVLVLVLLGAAALAAAARAGEPERAGVSELAKELAAGVDALARGTEPAKALAAFEPRPFAGLDALRADLRNRTVAAFTVDVSFTIVEAGAPVLRVDATFLADETPALVLLAGRGASPRDLVGPRLEDVKGGGEPLARAARALATALAAGEKATVPFAAPERVRRLASGDLLARTLADLERSRRAVARLGSRVAAVASGSVLLSGARATLVVREAGASKALVPIALDARGEKLGVTLARPESVEGKFTSWYPKDVTPPRGTRYPCALTALPKGLPGVPEEDQPYVDHAFATILAACQAKLVMLNAVHTKGADAALATYDADTKEALEKLAVEPVPAGLEELHEDIVSTLELQRSFFKDAVLLLKKPGQKYDAIWAIPSGKQASQRLLDAWSRVQARWPKLSPETKDSLYHHLCALDFF